MVMKIPDGYKVDGYRYQLRFFKDTMWKRVAGNYSNHVDRFLILINSDGKTKYVGDDGSEEFIKLYEDIKARCDREKNNNQ